MNTWRVDRTSPLTGLRALPRSAEEKTQFHAVGAGAPKHNPSGLHLNPASKHLSAPRDPARSPSPKARSPGTSTAPVSLAPCCTPPRHQTHTVPRLALFCPFAGASVEQGIERAPRAPGRSSCSASRGPCEVGLGGSAQVGKGPVSLHVTASLLRCVSPLPKSGNPKHRETSSRGVESGDSAGPLPLPPNPAGTRGCKKRSYLAAGVSPGLTGSSFPRWLLSAPVATEPLSRAQGPLERELRVQQAAGWSRSFTLFSRYF